MSRCSRRRVGRRCAASGAPAGIARARSASRRRTAPTQQHPAHRRAIGRQPRADAERDRHQSLHRHAQHVDDALAVEHRQRAAVVDALRERSRCGCARSRQFQRHRRTRARARAHAGSARSRGRGIARNRGARSVSTSRRAAARDRPVRAAMSGQAEARGIAAECAQHRQSARQGLHVVAAVGEGIRLGHRRAGLGLTGSEPRSVALCAIRTLCAMRTLFPRPPIRETS